MSASYPTTRWPAVGIVPRRSLLLMAGHLTLLVFLLAVALTGVYRWMPNVNFTAGVCLVVVALLCLALYDWRLPPEIILFGSFVVWTGITGLVARDMAWFWLYFNRLAQVGALAFAVAQIALTKRSASASLLVILSCSGMLCLYGWVSGDFALGGRVEQKARAASLLSNPNLLGFLLIYGTVVLAYFWGTSRSVWARWLIPAAAAVFAFSLLFTGSRKAFAGLLVFAVAWLWSSYRKQVLRNWRVVLVIAAVLAGCVLLTLYMMQYTYMGARFEETIHEGGLGKSRTLMYVQGIRLFYHHPIAGVGLGNFAPLSGIGAYSHSEYVEVLSTTGIIGALLYFPFYVILWLRLRRIERVSSDPRLKYQMGVFKAAVVCLLFLGFGAPHFLDIYFWVFMGTLIGYTFALDARHKTAMISPRRWRRAAIAR